MATEVVMPQMGESIAEGTITKWFKKVGDRVERDEPLFEISTDKVDAEIPSPAAGVLTEIKFKEGDTVEVNKVIAVLDGEGASASESSAPAAVEPPVAKADSDGSEEEAPVEAAAKAQEAETTAPSSAQPQEGADAKPAESQ